MFSKMEYKRRMGFIPIKNMNTLPVPHISQITTGALLHYNDCGSGSVLMVSHAYRKRLNMTVDQLYDTIMPSGDVALSASGLQKSLAEIGITNKWMVDMHIHDLLDAMIDKCPVIALVKYAPLVDAKLTEKTGFRGAHFVVVVGVDIKSVSINDPYWSSDAGKELEVPIAVFRQMWSQCYQDGNPNGGGIVMTLPIQDLSTPTPPVDGNRYTFTIYNKVLVNGANVSKGPGNTTTFGYVTTIWRTITPYINITTIQGDWGLLADKSGWVFMPFFKKI
jgi:hypothetical protein